MDEVPYSPSFISPDFLENLCGPATGTVETAEWTNRRPDTMAAFRVRCNRALLQTSDCCAKPCAGRLAYSLRSLAITRTKEVSLVSPQHGRIRAAARREDVSICPPPLPLLPSRNPTHGNCRLVSCLAGVGPRTRQVGFRGATTSCVPTLEFVRPVTTT